MIRTVILIPLLLLSADNYYMKSKAVCKTEININNAIICSINKLKNRDIKIISEVYHNFDKRFFDFYNINRQECKRISVKINIVKNHNELSNKSYFPNEDEYADINIPGSIIFGRYFRSRGTMYIVPPILSLYYWKKGFAHELTHHYFNICNIKFKNDREEHLEIEKFLNEYNTIFN